MMVSKTVALLAFTVALLGVTQGDDDWWKHAVFYQIYPRSFRDSDNSGTGDIKGITEKLPHLVDAGVTAMWISPIFQSPGVDQGYDISDYKKIDPLFGTLDDLKELLAKSHEMGLKVILDFVPNHTSDQHDWFKLSENRTEGYEDFYYWTDGKAGADGTIEVPTNWVSLFGNSSWQWSEIRKQYYLHQFLISQPDLNFASDRVKAAMKDVLTYWLDFGVDGFRIDAVPYLVEINPPMDELLSGQPDPNSYSYLIHNLTTNQPEAYHLIYDWRKLLDDYSKENGGDARIMMTEIYAIPELLFPYLGTPDGSILGTHFTFNFNFITEVDETSNAEAFAAAINMWLDNIPDIYTSNWVLGNHDQHRVATRFGPGNVDGFNMLMTILPGIGVTYNGEEIGQENGQVTYEQGQDPAARDPKVFQQKSRDFERTPFQWDDSVNAGFNDGAQPWLPVSDSYNVTNLAAQSATGIKSHFSIYKDLLGMRYREELRSGTTQVNAVSKQVLVVKRTGAVVDNQDFLGSVVVVFNIADEKQTGVDVSKFVPAWNTVSLSSLNSARVFGDMVDPNKLDLDPHESLVLSCHEDN